MPYAAPSSLLTRFGAEELAQVADRGTPRRVTADLLGTAAAGGDLSGWLADEVEAVNAALANIVQAIADAQSAIDGYLAGRYPTPMVTPPAIVQRLACDMARYFLHDDHAPEAVQKRYDAAVAFFRDVSVGKVSLGADAQAPQSTGGMVQMVSAPTVFGRKARGL